MNIEGQTLSVTATVQEANVAAAKMPLTLKNDDTSKTLWYKATVNEQESGAIGIASVLRAANWCELKAGEAVILPSVPMLYYVAATSETLTARILAGELTDAISAAFGYGTTFLTASFSTVGTGAAVIAAATGKQIKVYALACTLTAAGSVAFVDTASSPVTVMGPMSLDTNAGFVLASSGNVNMPWMTCTDEKALNATIVGGGTISGLVTYTQI